MKPLLRLLAIGLCCLPAAWAGAAAATHPDVRVLIDVSGSMKQNDPHNLRKPALALLVQLFPQGARAGVWTFGQHVDALVPHAAVTDAWRRDAHRKEARITSNALYTDIPAALEAATTDLDHLDPNYHTSVILLTDGMVDISKSPEENAAARRRVLDEILPRLRKAGVTVDTVALSKSADRELMERLAVDTGGLFAVAETADELNKVFLQAFDAAAPSEQVPLKGNHFLVDSSIDELTALVFHTDREPVVLVSPDHKKLSFASHGDDVKWFQGQGFDLITVTKPFEGEWTVATAVEQGSRVTIVSHLSLAASELPQGLFVSATAPAVTAALKQEDQVLTQPELLKLVRFSVKVQRREDGKQWQVDLGQPGAAPADGYYHGELPMLEEAGNYAVEVVADGKTFQRSRRQTVAVRDSFDVRVADTDAIPPGHRVTLFARNPEIDVAASAVTAHIQAPDGSTREQSLTASGEREWQLDLDGGGKGGVFQVFFDVAGQYRQGAKFSYHSATVAIGQNGTQVVTPAAAPQPEAQQPAHEPEPAPAQHAEPEKKPAAEPAPEPKPEPAKKDWSKWALYGGLALGNLLILGLGFAAFRMIMGGGKSNVLDAADDDAEEGADKKDKAGGEDKKDKKDKGGDKAEGKAKRSKAALDLPDDAIDIDAVPEKKK